MPGRCAPEGACGWSLGSSCGCYHILTEIGTGAISPEETFTEMGTAAPEGWRAPSARQMCSVLAHPRISAGTHAQPRSARDRTRADADARIETR